MLVTKVFIIPLNENEDLPSESAKLDNDFDLNEYLIAIIKAL